ncbi:MAG: pimeloyl-ACP methyl ester esterase BioH [Candidatus Accumulibacter sp.]|nr:pimeloyl-ACP methyl ester esterase BioH [Candidatus Accumulibacter propinquus]
MSRDISGKPQLALIHGWGLGSAVWQPVVEPLSRHYRVHLVDLPGYGQSPDDDAAFDETAQTVVDALPHPITLCGWSLGAMLAMRAALLAPQRVTGLVLVGATASFTQRSGWPEAQAPALLDSFTDSITRQPEQTLQRFVALLCQGDHQARSLTRTLRAGLRNAPVPASKVLSRGLHWLREVDLRALLPALTTRSLLIHGENDALNPLAAARRLAGLLPDARLEVFAGTGHAPFLADPQRFIQLLDDFRDAHTNS